MDFIKRALLFLKQKWARTILLVLTMTAILTFILSGLVIQNAATESANATKKAAGTTVTLSANRQALFSQARNSSSSSSSSSNSNTTQRRSINQTIISLDTVNQLASLSNVSNVQIASSATATADGFTPIASTQQSPFGDSSSSSVSISGVSSTDLVTAFKESNYKITSGRGITTSDVNSNNVVIEKQLASNNNLSVGSTIKVKDSNNNDVTLTVVGIYEAVSTASSDTGAAGPEMNDPSNTIYGSYTLASSISGNSGKVSQVTYTLTDSSKESTFVTDATKLIDANTLQLTTSSQLYQMLLQPMNNIKSFATKIIWVVAISGAAIMTLIAVMLIRERRREIGVLLSLGESKVKIIGQLFAEFFVVLAASLVFAGVIGNFFGKTMGEQLLAQQQTQQQTLRGAGGPGQTPGTTTTASSSSSSSATNTNTTQKTTTAQKNAQLNQLSTHISASSLLAMGGLGLVIISLATLLGTIPVVRFTPKKILTSE